MDADLKLDIRIDDLNDGGVIRLLQQHLREMHRYSPPESIHALDLADIHNPSITFWRADIGSTIAGCGALKVLTEDHGELKSMRTVETYLRRGIGSAILREIISEAQRRGYRRISLETGSHSAFDPSVCLYRKFGFEDCGPFGEYVYDPHSRFMTKAI